MLFRSVVAIDGYAGSGKTTVLYFLEKESRDILAVHLDDFIRHWKERKRMMDSATDRSHVFEFKWYRYQEVARLLKEFSTRFCGDVSFKVYDFEQNDFGDVKVFDLSKTILVIEGIFLFHPNLQINSFIDRRIYLAEDFRKADRRRIGRERKRWGKEYIPENHPDSYVLPFKIAYQRYIQQFDPAGQSDVVYHVHASSK